MPTKTKRGFGLLIVGVVLGFLVTQFNANYTGDSSLVEVLAFLVAIVSAVGLLGGIVLIVWGLLRD